MKKRILHSALSLTFVLGGLFLVPKNSEAQNPPPNMNYKITAVAGADGCSYIFCTNNQGSECTTPGSIFKNCNQK
jgi:hypothetical protein